MSEREAPTRGEGLVAYVLSALTTLLWVGCVLPAGAPLTEGMGSDATTPVHRDAILIVPALLLLVIMPVGCTLARRPRGMRAVLAGVDAFVALYVAIALVSVGFVGDAPSIVAVLTLFALGAMALVEVVRYTASTSDTFDQSALCGARLALALLVLILPLHIVMHPQVERASLLAPFVFIAASAGGSRIARHMRGLRRTAAVLQLVLAVHLLITLRYTVFRTDPGIGELYVSGKATLALAGAVVLVALGQLVLYFRRIPAAGSRDESVTEASAAPKMGSA